MSKKFIPQKHYRASASIGFIEVTHRHWNDLDSGTAVHQNGIVSNLSFSIFSDITKAEISCYPSVGELRQLAAMLNAQADSLEAHQIEKGGA